MFMFLDVSLSHILVLSSYKVRNVVVQSLEKVKNVVRDQSIKCRHFGLSSISARKCKAGKLLKRYFMEKSE